MKIPIALLTDFGLSDPYVGIMKGVILARAPEARIVDLSHGVPPQDVRAGALYLSAALPYFPDGTLFVCVVDPGVGSKRRILWARSDRHQFLAPDNGLLSWADRVEPLRETREVTNRLLFLEKVSKTFHGRDIFAPVAAALLRGTPVEVLGPKTRGIAKLSFPAARKERRRVRGQVLALDRFGNVITNLKRADLKPRMSLSVRGVAVGPVRTHYAAVAPGRSLALEGSTGLIEFSLREGNFAAFHGVTPGEAVYAE